jgi:hypothetical protein
MRPDVQKSFDWQRRYIPAWKRVLGEVLFAEASFEEDTQHNTDLLVLRLEAVRVAIRTRTFRELQGFHDREDQFTIRAARPRGTDTEFVKIMEGFGDVLGYGFASEAYDGTLCSWVVGNLKVFRQWFYRQLYQGPKPTELPGRLQSNHDGSSDFVGYYIDALPAGFVLGRRLYQAKPLVPLFPEDVPF